MKIVTVITIPTYGAPKSWTLMVAGVTPTTMVGFGGPTSLSSITITIGLLIVTVTGPGVRHTVGRGSAMNHGAGPLITTAGGFTTTMVGVGLREAMATHIVGRGGVPRWSRSSTSRRLTVSVFVGIH